ncbi:hypothetical protein M9H77_23703 [Catharanthus roseus]|uniref:Uncharacterized protein n=1 Tax=Catharanthus roseus TaxID=4058 RepID=A0ACC0AVK9_CATRO|nr:hypothetical protein M9H77_23703 [Catharanthus roseus]
MDSNVRTKSGEHGLSTLLYASSVGHIPKENWQVYRIGEYWDEKHGSSPRSQMASIHNMENQIKLLAKVIDERPLNNNIPSNMVTLWTTEEQVMTFSIVVDEEETTAQAPEESNFLEKEEAQQEIIERRHDDLLTLEEPTQITSVVEESKRDECLPGNKSEFEGGEPEKENESLLTNKPYPHIEDNSGTQISVEVKG